ncbi:MAG: hypothetical protein ABIN96_04765 [Rubrivivax sp.]
MPSDVLPSDGCKLASLFAARTAGAVDAQAVGAVMAVAWMAIERTLRAVVGAPGAAALYTRSLYLAARQHAWLLDVWADGDRKVDVTRLRVEMAKRNIDEAVAAGQFLLRTFDRLLSGLIGESLMEQLLLPVYEEPWHNAPDEGRTT